MKRFLNKCVNQDHVITALYCLNKSQNNYSAHCIWNGFYNETSSIITLIKKHKMN